MTLRPAACARHDVLYARWRSSRLKMMLSGQEEEEFNVGAFSSGQQTLAGDRVGYLADLIPVVLLVASTPP